MDKGIKKKNNEVSRGHAIWGKRSTPCRYGVYTSCSLISKDFILLPTTFNSSSNSRIFLKAWKTWIPLQFELQDLPQAMAYLIKLNLDGFEIVTTNHKLLLHFIYFAVMAQKEREY